MHPETAIQALIDRQAITDVLYRYCRGCDRADEDALRACFHADSTHRHGAFEGLSHDFIGFAMDVVRPLLACKHLLTNVCVALEVDRAETESHYWAYQRRRDPDTGEEEDYFTGGRYLDRFERREGSWKIVHRVGLIDFESVAAPSDRGLWQAPASQRSGQYPEDPLYHEFTSLLRR